MRFLKPSSPGPPPGRVLLVDTKGVLPPEFPAAWARESQGGLHADVVADVDRALQEIAKTGVDLVVCWAERRDDLIGVIQLRKGRPKLPIVVVSSRTGPSFKALATRMGATRVVPQVPDLSTLLKTLQLALVSGELAREVHSLAAENFIRIQEIQLLAQETRRLARGAHALIRPKAASNFSPLLVEDDPDQALLMGRALEKAGVVDPRPVMRSGEEAIEYLSGVFIDVPPPTIVLLDLELPRKSGLEVLEWMKSRPALVQIPAVILSSSTRPDHVNRAYELGAHAYLLKPTSYVSLVELVAKLAKQRVVPPGPEA